MLATLALAPAKVLADPATLVSHVVGSPATTGDGGLGNGVIPFGESAISVPLRLYAIARDSGDVVFTSSATNLVAGQVDGEGNDLDVYHWERATGIITLVSHEEGDNITTCSGGEARVFSGGISADGNTVVYMSDCDDLVAGLPGVDSTFSWDRASNTNFLVSRCIDFITATTVPVRGLYPVISADGSAIYYTGTSLDPGFFCPSDSPPPDITAGVLVNGGFSSVLVTHVAGNNAAPAVGLMDPRNRAISDDGQYIVYSSEADDLVAGQTATTRDNLFLYDVATNTSQLVTHTVGIPAQPATATTTDNFDNTFWSFSADGSTVAFTSAATDLVAGFIDANGAGAADVYAYDRVTQANRLVSHRFDNVLSAGDTGSLGRTAINADGTRIAHTSASTDHIAGQVGSDFSIFLWESAGNTNRLVSHAAGSPVTTGGGFALNPVLDSSGTRVAYTSTGSAMVAGLTDVSGRDQFLWFESSDQTLLVSRNATSATTTDNGADAAILASDPPLMDATGTFVLFPSEGTNVVPGQVDGNGDADLFLFEVVEPTVSFAVAASAVTEGTGASITVQLSAPTVVDVIVPFTIGGTAATPADFSVTTATPITIPAGSVSTTIDLTTVDDTLDENAETVVVTLGSPTNATLAAPSAHTLTLNDNDAAPTVTFAAAASAVTEGTGASITVQLSTASGLNVTIPFTQGGGTAATPADFSVTTASPIVIPAGSTSATISVTTANDTTDEPAETVVLTLNAPTNGVLGAPSAHTLTINDNDLPPTVSFAAATSNVIEGAGGSVTVQLSAASGFDVTVNFSAGGTAADPADYSVTTASPVTILAGATSATISLTTVDDPTDESSETIVLTLAGPVNATLGAPSVHTVTLVDNDGTPSVSFAAAAGSTGEGGSVNVIVELSSVSAVDVTVPFTISGSATNGSDFTVPTASPLTIPAGSITGSITVNVAGDVSDEPAETVILTLGAPVNATLGAPSQHALTINDDDGPPTVRFLAASSNVSEGNNASITVQLSSPSAFNVTVPFNLGGTAARPADYAATSSPITIPAGQVSATIQVVTVEDAIDEPAETVVATLQTPTNATLAAPSEHTLAIADDDNPPFVRFASASSTIGEGVNASISVSLSAESGFDVTVNVATSGTATRPGDYDITSTIPVVFPAGTTTALLTLATVADGAVEGDESAIFTLSSPVNASPGPPSSHTLTIDESAPPPTVRFALAQSEVAEGEARVIALQLSAAVGATVEVPFTLSGSVDASDHDLAAGSVTFAPGSTSATITVSAIDDAVADPGEALIVTLGPPSNASLGVPAEHRLDILDNEGALTAVFPTETLALREGNGALVQVQLSGPSATDTSIPFTISGAATQGTDYTISASPLVIPAGSTAGTITINALTDRVAERSERLTLTLGTPSAAKASDTLVITIVDPAPQVNFVATQALLTEGYEIEVEVELEEVLAEDAEVSFIPTSVHGEPGATPDDYVLSESPIRIPAGERRGRIRLLALPDTIIEVDECMLLTLEVSVNSVPGPRSDHLVVIHSEGGSEESGGALGGLALAPLLLLALVRGRRRHVALLCLGFCAPAGATDDWLIQDVPSTRREAQAAPGDTGRAEQDPASATPDDGSAPQDMPVTAQPFLATPQGRDWWTTGDAFAISLGSDVDAARDVFALELDAIDVTSLTTRAANGQVLVFRPAQPLKPGLHKLRLVRQTDGGELREIGVWELEMRKSEMLRSGRLLYAIAAQGGGTVLSSEDLDHGRAHNGNGSLRLETQADTGLATVAAHANLLTDSNALRTHQDEIQLGDFKVTGSDGDAQIVAGNQSIAPIGGQPARDFAYDGGNRRGVSLSTRIPIASATVTAYSVGSEPLTGFRNGLGFSHAGSRFSGGLFQALPYAAGGNQIGVSAGYIRGNGRRGGTAIYSAEEGLLVQVPGVEGSVGNAVVDTRWLSGALGLRAEYARSERHFPLIRGVALEPVTDHAQSYVLTYQSQQGLQIGEYALTGNVTLDHQRIGTAFRSIASPGGTIDIAQNRIATGLQYRTVSLDLSAARSEDNVAGGPFATTEATNLGAQVGWSPQFEAETLPSFIQQPNFSVGIGSDKRRTALLPPDSDESQRVDTDSRNLAVTAAFAQPLGGWSLSYSAGATDDGTEQSPATRNHTASLDANFQFGDRINLTTQLYTDTARQLLLIAGAGTEFEAILPASSTRTISATMGLNVTVIPSIWAVTLGYAASRARAGDGSLESRNQQADFSSTWTMWKISFFLRGSYQHGVDESLILPFEDEFGQLSPPEYQRSRRESYQGLAGFSFNFRGT